MQGLILIETVQVLFKIIVVFELLQKFDKNTCKNKCHCELLMTNIKYDLEQKAFGKYLILFLGFEKKAAKLSIWIWLHVIYYSQFVSVTTPAFFKVIKEI